MAIKNRKNHHHIYPKSRFRQLRKNPHNLAEVNIDDHALYHLLFKNKSPEEVIAYLNLYYWNNSFTIELKRNW